MSGLYALGIIALWVALNFALWKAWWRNCREAGKNRRRVNIAFAVFALAWLSISFWYGGGRKFYYDAEVERLCAIDGGVKIYEVVELSADKFNEYGVVRIPSKEAVTPVDEYFYESHFFYYRRGNPEIWRVSFFIVRKLDSKVISVATSYARRGGDFPGPWHESSFGCPIASDISDIKKQTFFVKN